MQKTALAEKWTRFVETSDAEGRLDFYGQQRLAGRTIFESGEALAVWTPVARRGDIEWTVAILEPDFLDTGKTGPTSSGGMVIQGVEFNAGGQRVAYWIFERHPGDRFGFSGATGGLTSKRIDAQFIDHMFEQLRPGQVRGVPWLAPVALTLLDLKDLAEAELVRKKLEACITGVVTSPNPEEDPTVGKPLTDADGNTIDRMSPGMWLHASAGNDVEFMAPPPSEGLVEHMRERLHAVAAGCGLTYYQLTGDLSDANYSSMRGGVVEFRQLLDGWQSDLMVQPFCRPAWNRVQGSAAPRARYIPPARPWVDPANDIKAKIAAIANYLESPQDVISSQGEDPEDQLDEHQAWAEALRQRDLPDPNAPAETPANDPTKE